MAASADIWFPGLWTEGGRLNLGFPLSGRGWAKSKGVRTHLDAPCSASTRSGWGPALTCGWRYLDLDPAGPGGARAGAAGGRVGMSWCGTLPPGCPPSRRTREHCWLASLGKETPLPAESRPFRLSQPPSPDTPCPADPCQQLLPQHVPSEASSPPLCGAAEGRGGTRMQSQEQESVHSLGLSLQSV